MHSGRIAFLGFKDFIIKLMSSTVGLGKSNEAKFLKFSDYTWMIFVAWNEVLHCAFIMV